MKKPKPLTPPIKAILKKGESTPIPENIIPMLATLVSEPVEDVEWVYEMKWDGFRALAYLSDGFINISSRNNKSFNEKFYPVYDALKQWKINAVLDGEIVVVNEQGLPDFEALQLWRSEADGQLLYYLFDILWLDGISLMQLSLEDRRKLLEHISSSAPKNIRLSETLSQTGKEAFAEAEKYHLEGLMAKKRSGIYIPGARTKDWVKIKTEKRQELVIGGYTLNEGTSKLFSALLLGIVDNGSFNFVTSVGTGFNREMQKYIIKKLKPFETQVCQFAEIPEFNKPSRFRPNPPKATVTWVKPKLVAEISYREMTKGGSLRHPSFKGLREDKSPAEVVIELPAETQQIVSGSNLVKENVITAPQKKQRKTLLNPKDQSQVREINGHEINFKNLGKIYWPKENYTKRDLINYYYQIAPYILPYLMDRPQTLNRHPNGINGKSFYQKDVKGKAPEWLETFPYYSQKDKREKEFPISSDEASLLYLVSLGCIEINPWHSRRSSPDHPDWCIIDLDPDQNSFAQVIEAACVTKKILDAIKVPSYCKTSGSTGLHIYIPLGAKYTFEDSKEFGRRIVKVVHHQLPKYTSIERKTSDREGKMYLDFLQNRPQATVAAPYSLRPKPFAPVSMPLHWDEVKKGLQIKNHNITNAIERVKSEGDLFKGLLSNEINLEKVTKKMHSLFPDILGTIKK